jgi:hypothetical protein
MTSGLGTILPRKAAQPRARRVNYRLLQTQSRMLGVPMHPKLTGAGGYGEPFDMERLDRAVAKVDKLVRLASASSVEGAPAFRLQLFLSESRVQYWDEAVRLLPVDVEATNPDRPYAVSKHHIAPQVESCSASRVNYLAEVLGPEFKDTHFVFMFDPEYVPHYVSWLFDPDAVRKLLNTILCPHKFHFRKHVAEVRTHAEYHRVWEGGGGG